MHHTFAYTFIDTSRNAFNPPGGDIAHSSPDLAFIKFANSRADSHTTLAQSVCRVQSGSYDSFGDSMRSLIFIDLTEEEPEIR
jgi:hypothetical protein